MKIAKHIGYDVTASGQILEMSEDKKYQQKPAILDLFTTSTYDEYGYCPPSHIVVNSQESIRALRDFCNELLNESKV